MRQNKSLHAWLTAAAATAVGAVAGVAAVRAVVRGRRKLDLSGKVVLIMGGSRGLGLVIARQFADAGASVAICARDNDELTRARHDVAQHGGGDVMAMQCDVTDP